MHKTHKVSRPQDLSLKEKSEGLLTPSDLHMVRQEHWEQQKEKRERVAP